MEENKKETKKKKQSKIKEMLKDKKGRAKLELMMYAIFFIVVIIFGRIMSGINSTNISKEENNTTSFIELLEDNYELTTNIRIDDNLYIYEETKLGYNSVITKQVEDVITKYQVINNKYYILEEDNYILTTIEEVYSDLSYRYLNINNIRQFLKVGTKENNTYRIKLSDIILNNTSEEYITVVLNETSSSLTIDYTNLIKLEDENINKVTVTMTYKNIGNITTLG